MPHSPGPWHLGKWGTKRAVYGPQGEEVCVFTGMLSDEETLANARLIVAAPALLAALRTALEEPDDLKAIQAVKAAIEEATGGG